MGFTKKQRRDQRKAPFKRKETVKKVPKPVNDGTPGGEAAAPVVTESGDKAEE